MSKFNFDFFANEDETVLAFNKEKYTVDESLKIAKEELYLSSFNFDANPVNLVIYTGYIKFGFYYNAFTGEVENGWHAVALYEEDQIKPKNKNAVECWFVRE